MMLAQELRAESCAPDNKFPHTYTEISVSASGCLVSRNSCLLITRKGHQKKKRKKQKARVARNFLSVPRTRQRSNGEPRGRPRGLARQGARGPVPPTHYLSGGLTGLESLKAFLLPESATTVGRHGAWHGGP